MICFKLRTDSNIRLYSRRLKDLVRLEGSSQGFDEVFNKGSILKLTFVRLTLFLP